MGSSVSLMMLIRCFECWWKMSMTLDLCPWTEFAKTEMKYFFCWRAFSCSSLSASPSFSIYSFFLATNASIVSSGVVTVLSPNRVLLENQYFHSETFTFHHISFSSILISNCFHVSPGGGGGPFNYYVTLLGGGGRPSVTLCDRGRGSAERYVTPEIIYMYNIILKFLLLCMFIYT